MMVGGIEAEETDNADNSVETCRFVLTRILVRKRKSRKRTKMAETNKIVMIIASRLIFRYSMEQWEWRNF
ncbi:hypothetical protein LINGRAPRIM_LOCUS3439 [Linum grandiflorum]